MDNVVSFIDLTFDDIWDYVVKWDVIFSKKLIKEKKVDDFCDKLAEIPEIIYVMMTHKLLSLSPINNDHIVIYHRNEISMYLANIIYHAIYPFHKSELTSREINNWKERKYWEYRAIYDTKRQQVLNNPLDIDNIKYGIVGLNNRKDAIIKDDIIGVDMEWDYCD